ncbi:MAG TPA: hypothetical protein VK012_00540 [Gemmatimonadales bacterium]|nr:hypothetical protein [Gemmatimonadales bacterium]
MRTSLKFVLALMAGVATASPAAAQLSSNIDASATVLAALSVTGNNDLAFGNIAPTQSKVVGAAAGGHFAVSGASGASVSFRFPSLPATLQIADLTLSNWTGLHSGANVAGGATAFTPTAGSDESVTLSGTGTYFVWVGATLQAGAGPIAPGGYSEPITLEVFYN